jgi:hypothetical protein
MRVIYNLNEVGNNNFKRLSNDFDFLKDEEFNIKKFILLNLLLSFFLLYNISIYYCLLMVILDNKDSNHIIVCIDE